MNRPLALLAVLVTAFVVALAAQGNSYTYSKTAPRLRMFIAGTGQPAVVFENGLNQTLAMWRRTQLAVSEFAPTVAYDRASGVGGSDAGPEPRDARQVARELHAALQELGLPPPYVLVGHSLGGLFVRVYADLYPQEVAALVLVDPTRPFELDAALLADSEYPEARAMAASMQQADAARLRAGLPVFLISAQGARGEPWRDAVDATALEERAAQRAADLAAHRAWLSGLDNGELIVTHDSGHMVPVEQPALVIETIRRAVAAARR